MDGSDCEPMIFFESEVHAMTSLNSNKPRRPKSPGLMSAEERLKEASRILATGIERLLKKEKTEKLPLDKSPSIRPYGQKPTQGEDHE
jgi:hypothetical protein